MLHPQYWSLRSVLDWLRLRSLYHKYGVPQNSIMTENDLRCYALLDVKGKTVLDVGAFIGDSASFFLHRGARKVLCVEANWNYANRINLKHTTVLNEKFSLNMLTELEYDCVKMDIEGYEAELLDYPHELKPMVVEVHNSFLVSRFMSLGFACVGREVRPFEVGIGQSMMINFSERD